MNTYNGTSTARRYPEPGTAAAGLTFKARLQRGETITEYHTPVIDDKIAKATGWMEGGKDDKKCSNKSRF